jgi:Flp pilus assembly protein TadG
VKHDRRAGRDQRTRRGERGQAVVELALVLPLFMLLVFGMIEFGKGLNYWIDLTHVANEGARYATVNRWPSCPGDETAACPEELKTYLTDRVNTDELRDGGSSNVPNTPGVAIDICFPETQPDPGNAVRVTVSTTYSLAVVDGLLGAIGLDTIADISMSASSTQRLEREPTANRLLAESSPACP